MRLLLLVLFLTGCGSPQLEQTEAEVVNTAFTAGRTAWGYDFGKNGGVTMNTTSDQYHLFVKTPDGGVHQIEVTQAEWVGKKVGDKVPVYRYGTGRWKLN